jgi:DNA-binding CsgD family transcriptional regulator
MLRFIDFKHADAGNVLLVPEMFKPLLETASSGADLTPTVRSIVKLLGFDSFMCGFSSTPRPNRNAQLYVFTTLPREWAQIYDDEAYIEIDPRIQLVYDRSTMVVWNAEDLYGKSARLNRFLEDAARFGVRSGACFTLHDVNHNGVLVCYNSSKQRTDVEQVERNLGTLYAFGTHFHEVFMRNVVERGIPSRLRGAALTNREVQVLALVARGMTDEDISIKLSITPRTVKFHMDSARTKMCAANRQEAVALAVKAGLFDVLP